MIQEFILSTLLIAALLFFPGFLFLKSFRLSSIKALCFSPLVTIFSYSLTGIALDKLQIPTTGWILVLPMLVLALIAFGVSKVINTPNTKYVPQDKEQRDTSELVIRKPDKRLWLILLGYCAIGTILYCVIYLSALPTLSNVPEDYDNIFHFNLARSFLDSGSWSLLSSSIYLDSAGEYPAPFSAAGKYYPAAWHILCLLPVSIIGANIGVAANALNLVLVAFVFSSAMFVFLAHLFKDDWVKLALGSVIVFAFGAFPWVLLTFWPLYPNFISMVLAPLVCAAFLMATEHHAYVIKRIVYALLVLVGICAEAFCQPNSIFVAITILAPYVVYAGSEACSNRRRRWKHKVHDDRVMQSIGDLKAPKRRNFDRIVFGCIITLAILLIWFALTELPFMQRVINTYTAPLMSTSQALASSVSLSLTISSSQYALGVLVVVGAVYVLMCDRSLIWVLVSYCLVLLFFVVAVSFGDIWVKHFLTGFWYTDPYRIASIVPIVGIPIAITGLYAICVVLASAVKKIAPLTEKPRRAVFCLIPLLFTVAIYIPGVFGNADSNVFKFLRFASTDAMVADNRVAYSNEEKSFIEQVKQAVGDDTVVLNNPFDGSMLAYGLSGLPVYNRSRTNYGTSSESPESAIFREHLNELATNEEVQKALEAVGAEYVLAFDKSTKRMKILFYNYDPDAWNGFTQVSEETPGLELVLSDGGMKLYKIVI